MLGRIAFRNLLRNPRRTLSVLITVAIGAGALLCFDGFIKSVMAQYESNTIHANYGNGQVYVKDYRDHVYAEPWEHWITDWKELKSFIHAQPGVEYVFPRVSFSTILKKGKVTVNGLGQGIDAASESQFFFALNIISGKPLENQSRGILLGKGLADSLNVKPGDSVEVIANTVKGRMNQMDFKVAGIFHTGKQEFDNRIFRITLEDALKLIDTNRVETVAIGLNNSGKWKEVAASIEKAYPKYQAYSFAELDKIYYQHSVDWLKAQFGVVQWIIVGIVLLGIFNTTATAILERKQEIGNLRANGESKLQVMILLISEGVVLGALGALAGIAISCLIMQGIFSKGIEMPPGPGMTKPFVVSIIIQWPMMLKTLAMSVLAAIAATALAGIKVVRLSIAEALRSN